MSLQGQLTIELHIESQANGFSINNIAIELNRPIIAEKMLVNQKTQTALERISHMMTVCQHAQLVATKIALKKPITPSDIQGIVYENIEQLLWRLLIDLPKVCHLDVDLSHFIALRQAIKQASEIKIIQRLANSVFNQVCQSNAQEFSEFDVEQFNQWLATSGSLMAQCLVQVKKHFPSQEKANSINVLEPTTEQLSTLATLLASNKQYSQTPTIANKAAETGCYAKSVHSPLFESFITLGTVGRYAARLIELAKLISELAQQIESAQLVGEIENDQYQLAWVQTARGLLVHKVQMQSELIKHYDILAPTEWNFHPEGALKSMLVGKSFSTETEAINAAKLMVIILDPCIEFSIGVSHA